MSEFMLDSNVLIDMARDPAGLVAKRFVEKGLGDVGLSVIVAGEVRYGMQKRPDARSNPRMAYFLTSLETENMPPGAADIYSRIRADSEQRGLSISPNDYWIAAHAISSGAVLVTGDRTIHEAGIADLKLEDWRDIRPVQGQG